MSISFRRVSLNIFGLRGATLLINVFILSVSAKYFGLSLYRDIWVIATAFAINVNNAFFNPVSDVFRIKYVQVEESESSHSALIKTGSLLVYYFIFLSCICIAYQLWGKFIINHLYFGDAATLQNYYYFIGLLLYSIFFTQFISIGTGILNANHIYYIPEITFFFTSLCNLAIICLVTPYIGIYSLYVGQYFSLFVLLVCILCFLKKNHVLPIFNFSSFSFQNAKPFILFGLPFYFPYIAGQASSLVEKSLSSKMGVGIISMLDYAQKFTSSLQMVFTGIILTTIIPQLTKSFTKKETELYNKDFFNYLKFIFFVLSFVVPILYVSSYEINYIFFKRGEVSLKDIEAITSLTKLYAVAFIPICLYCYITPAMISQMKNKLQAVLAVLLQLLIIGFNYFFYKIFKQSVFALSLGIFHLITVLVMLYCISLRNKNKIYLYLAKSAAAMLVLLFLSETAYRFIHIGNVFLSLIVKSLIVAVMSAFLSSLFGINIFSYAKSILNRWKQKT